MKKFNLILCLLFVFGMTTAKADSPLTSTPFWTAYKSIKEVSYAQENGMDKKTLKFLGGKKGSSVTKLIVINSLSWKNGATKTFEDYLLAKRKGLKPEVFTYLKTATGNTPEENEQTKLLTADDLMCWAYVSAMDDYNNPNLAMRGAFLAVFRDQENMAYATSMGLIASQLAFDTDWCNVYQISNRLIVETEYTNNQLTDEAVKIIMDYIGLYKQDCKE